MTTITDITKLPAHILKRVIRFKEKMETLERGMAALLKEALIRGDSELQFKTGGRKISAKTRAKMVAAAKARWARDGEVKAVKKKRKMSAAGRAKIAAAARARWAKAKAAGKTSL